MHRTKHSHGNTWDTHSDTESCVYGSITHSHPCREGAPRIYQRGQSCSNTCPTSSTHELRPFQSFSAPSQGSGVKDGGGYYKLPGSDPSTQQPLGGMREKRSCLWRLPSPAAVMPSPFISLSSPYALPHSVPLLCKYPHGLSPPSQPS